MKKRLFVLFMAAVVGFTGMPMTFANAADDVVTTTEDEQPDAYKTVSGNYGVTLTKPSTFRDQLTTELSKKLYDKFEEELITNKNADGGWIKRYNQGENGQYYVSFSYRGAVPGDMKEGSGRLNPYDGDIKKRTVCNDNFITAMYDAMNALRNRYTTELNWMGVYKAFESSSDISYNLWYDGVISNDENYTDCKICIAIDEDWNPELDGKVSEEGNKILEEANDFAAKNYPDNRALGQAVYFDQWLVNNCGHTSSTMMNTFNSSSIYAAFLNKGSLDSLGYANAMSYLLDKAGVENELQIGFSNSDETIKAAWNTIKLTDGNYYYIDSYKNDYQKSFYSSDDKVTCEDRPYLLIGSDEDDFGYCHLSNGLYLDDNILNNIKKFNYTSVSAKNYLPSEIKGKNILVKGKSAKINIAKDDLKKYIKNKAVFTTTNSDICTVNKKGKIKAIKPGECKINIQEPGAAKPISVDVIVYNVDNVYIGTQNGGASRQDIEINSNAILTTYLSVQRSTGTTLDAKEIKKYVAENSTKPLKFEAKSSKKKVVEVKSCLISGDTIQIKYNALKKGKAKITVYYGNKKAILNLKVISVQPVSSN